MLAGWLRLDTPPHAVIATALPLLEGGPQRLAHGVFGALVRQEVKLPAAPTLPAAVRERWGERAAAIAAGLALPPPLDLTLRDPAATAEWTERLGGMSLIPGMCGWRAGMRWKISKVSAKGHGGSRISPPACLRGCLGRRGKRVLDLCAAPGGKTMQLAAADWHVTALDASARRLERVQANLERTGLTADLVVGDALSWEPAEAFDAVLLDAPCTATGTCRRHPDVLHRIGSAQIAQMAELQARLLDRAAGWVKPGGQLVYAVCSLEIAEGPDQARAVTLQRDPICNVELPTGLTAGDDGWLRTSPAQLAEVGGIDGFFVARWCRADLRATAV